MNDPRGSAIDPRRFMPAAEENATNWFILRGRERGGPYPYALAREGARGGLISRHDLVWRSGWDGWRDAGSIDGLFAGHGTDRDAELVERGGVPGPQRARATPLPPAQPTFTFQSPARGADQASSNYVTGHWRGEFSLAAAFLGNGLVVGLILVIVASAFYTIVAQTKLSAIPLAMMAIAVLALCLASIVWFLVGVWRSVSRRRSRVGSRARWTRALFARRGPGAKAT
jgi:hypothetical protein